MKAVIVIATLMLTLVSCGSDPGTESIPVPVLNLALDDTGVVTLGTSSAEFFTETGTSVTITRTVPANSDVYFILTNIDNTTRSGLSIQSQSYMPPLQSAMSSQSVHPGKSRGKGAIKGRRGKPEVDQFIRKGPEEILKEKGKGHRDIRSLFSLSSPEAPLYDMEGDSGTLSYSPSTGIPATCRLVREDVVTDFGTKTLNIWVANDSYGAGCGKAYCVTQEMVEAVADRFLIDGLDNDIYDWVTGIFGEEWGPTGSSNYIGDNDEITILIYDIDGDNSANGGVTGFFWPKDNYRDSVLSSSYASNERIMFYLDGVMLANPYPDGSWDITDPWPADLVSTLAHELQHMIHFYQKTVLRAGGSGTETWINEICSLATEDMVSYNMQVEGPRGVAYDDPTAGASGITSDRLARYNAYNTIDVTSWASSAPEVYKNYSIAYALGAHLIRNYDGAVFLRDVVQSSATNYTALTSSAGTTFITMLRRWGVSVILSDQEMSAPSGYLFNSGDWFITGDYSLGSINLYNYDFGVQSGPRFYNLNDAPSMTFEKRSNTFFLAGEDLSGEHQWEITVPANCYLTLVMKPH